MTRSTISPPYKKLRRMRVLNENTTPGCKEYDVTLVAETKQDQLTIDQLRWRDSRSMLITSAVHYNLVFTGQGYIASDAMSNHS